MIIRFHFAFLLQAGFAQFFTEFGYHIIYPNYTLVCTLSLLHNVIEYRLTTGLPVTFVSYSLLGGPVVSQKRD
jgi:hypothetical protein